MESMHGRKRGREFQKFEVLSSEFEVPETSNFGPRTVVRPIDTIETEYCIWWHQTLNYMSYGTA
jgi:hypothetical protein